MTNKLLDSEKWLRKKYLRDRLSIPEIMEASGASRKTVYNYLDKYGLKR